VIIITDDGSDVPWSDVMRRVFVIRWFVLGLRSEGGGDAIVPCNIRDCLAAIQKTM
jgi:hypothetical protein